MIAELNKGDLTGIIFSATDVISNVVCGITDGLTYTFPSDAEITSHADSTISVRYVDDEIPDIPLDQLGIAALLEIMLQIRD